MGVSIPILDSLNPAQREAVTTTEGPLLVIAGAGSGKTRVITHRIAYLVREKGIHPWQIFAATFTNKAAEEMRHRINAMLPGYETARLTVATFHSICVGILRQEATRCGLTNRFTIADDTDQMALIKDCMRELEVTNSRIRPEDIQHWIARAKLLMATAEETRRAIFDPQAEPESPWHASPAEIRNQLGVEPVADYARVYSLYEARLQQSNAVDFDDLLLKVVRLFQSDPEVLGHYQERWKHFLVDEYQDTNRVQSELMRLLASRYRNICVVGDEDQSIYSWRGAEIENILNFPKEWPGARIIRLEQNYRSTETILEVADAVIAHNTQRHGKVLWSDRGMGEPVTLVTGMDEREEAALVIDAIRRLHRDLGIAYKAMAIFYRVNALSRLFEDFLREAKIAYRVIGGIRFYDRAEIKDMLAYLRLTVNPLDGLSFARIINKPRRGIGDKTLTKLFTDATARGVSLYEQVIEAIRSEDVPKKTRAGLSDLITMISSWRDLIATKPPPVVLDQILKDTGYEESLGEPTALETLSRIENLEELRRALEEYHENNPGSGLDDYLEKVSLSAAVDQLADEEDSVSLMTLHSAKGLEFPCVFMTGLEEGIFPSPRAVSETGRIEEERRLFYVGITRARDRLFLTRADSRSLYGRKQYNPPSIFLIEAPETLTQSYAAATRSWSAPKRRETPAMPARRSATAAAFADAGGEAPPTVIPEEPHLFPAGSRIRHSRLGEGEVLAVRGSGANRKISIRFDAGLELEVLELYGGLELVEDLPY